MIVALENLRLRALALRSSVHNEQQLSAVELAGMNAKKTNEIIDVVNELCEIVGKLNIEELGELLEKLDSAAHDLLVNYDETTESLTITTVEKEV